MSEPATPLPWSVYTPGENVCGIEHLMSQLSGADGTHIAVLQLNDADYIAEACNAYPNLVAELASYKSSHTQALEYVDQVFQVCAESPRPILADYAKLGENKFAAVVRLAEDYVKLKAELAERDKPCVWNYDPDHFAWNTSCGGKWAFIDGGPKENGAKHCLYCGHPIESEESDG